MDKCKKCKTQRTSGGFLWCVTCRMESAARCAERRASFLADELCSECGDNFGELKYGGTSIRNCDHHLEYYRARMAAKYHHARQQGLCAQCYRPAPKADVVGDNGYKRKTYCAECSASRSEYNQKRKAGTATPMKRAA